MPCFALFAPTATKNVGFCNFFVLKNASVPLLKFEIF